MRGLSAIIALATALLAAVPVAAAAELASAASVGKIQSAPPQLNPHIVVEDQVIRLGDLFTNTGDNAEIPIAYAPEPGQSVTLDARWLYRVAVAYKLDWKPLGIRTESLVERASVTVPFDEVKSQLLNALADRGIPNDADIELATRLTQIYLPAGSTPTVRVDAIDYFERTGRFTAVISAPGGGEASRMRLSGRVFRTIEVPVLSDRVLRGDVITQNDISYVKMNADRVQPNIIVDAGDLVGMTPKNGIRAGQPVRTNDVRRPTLVSKNSFVVIVHHMPNMLLTAQGKAMENGSEGDIVKIKNMQSTQIIEAEVIGPGRVAVKSAAQQLSLSMN